MLSHSLRTRSDANEAEQSDTTRYANSFLLPVSVLCIRVAVSKRKLRFSEIARADSSIKFHVKSSVTIAGKFDQWDAALIFTSPDEKIGVLEINIQAASVDTGSGMKNGKLKSKDFFDVARNPVITFKSTKFVQTGSNTFEVDGDFTIRGVSNPEKLTLTISGNGTGSSEINGTMAFDETN